MQPPAPSREHAAAAAPSQMPHPAVGEVPSAPAPLEPAPPALQPLDYTSLRAVISELAPALVPSRFEKAQQSDPATVQLGLRGLAGTHWLELSWLAEAPRLLAIPAPPRHGDGSTLAQQLQHALRGLALVGLHQPAWERVVELRFAPRPGEPVQRTLVLELMGRHSNLFLLDAEGRVIALARQVRDRQSRLRPIGTGDPYQSPPALGGEPPRLQDSFEAWRQRLTLLPLPLGKALLGAYQGTSPALVRQLLADGESAGTSPALLPVAELQEAQWQRLWARWRGWLRALEQGRFGLWWSADGGYRCWFPGPEPPSTAALEPDPSSAAALEPASAPASVPRSGSVPWIAGSGTGQGAVHSPDVAWLQAPDAAAEPWPLRGAEAAGPMDRGRASGGDPGGVAAPASLGSGAALSAGQAAGHAVIAMAAAQRGLPDHSPAGGALREAGALEINRALAAYYGTILAGRRWRQRQQALESRLQGAIAREQAQLEQQQALLEAVPAADGLQRQADGLLCLPDPDRQTIDEAQALYRRARKLRRSTAAITPRIALHRQRLAGLETSLTFLQQLEGLEPLEGLEEELQEQLERLRPQACAVPGARRRARRRQGGQAEPQPLELRSTGGLRLQVGRNHRQNEWISLRHARRGDLWFHAQELPGSHVVLKGSEAPLQQADLQAAADLAAHFSRGRGNRRVPVVMVPAETLQRIPGAEPGTVRHRGGEVLWGEPERALALLRKVVRKSDPADQQAAIAP